VRFPIGMTEIRYSSGLLPGVVVGHRE